MNEEKVTLDLNKPEDARRFLLECMTELNIGNVTHVLLQDGRQLAFKDMNDGEVVQYAWELLPIYQAANPELVNINYEH